ncbi:hypothetical protein A8135_07465 [Legionella jamestowniensis]|uniref:Protein with a bacterial immunoglobulin-like domain protein n=2 Tax=Legionella jamestowniensis TaxID=455 RepID=A0ABX2XYJ9_9GAMM|nr:hypothetical protein A8135_07465 [Legionella jamestowniensis]
MVSIVALFWAFGAQAGAQPKFIVEVRVRAPLELINSGIGFAQYRITNKTTITRRLTMVPIPGVQVMSTGCSSVFTLAPGGSCLLNLRLVGSAMGAGVHGGPIICKTKGNTNDPDRFLCSQPLPAELLNVTIIPTHRATISVSPTILKFTENSSASIIVTNSVASGRSAENIMAHIPSNSPLRVLSTTCRPTLSPGASCRITFTSPSSTMTTVRVQGTNTNAVNVAVSVSEALISLSPTSLTFAVNDSGTVTVTNTSSAAALNVAASIPAGSSISVVNSTCPASLAPSANCTIEFTATAQETTQVTIRGTNTNIELLPITVAAQPVLTLSPTRAVITVDGTSTPTLITVTNTSTQVTATQVSATLPASWGGDVVQNSSDCVTLAPGASCTLAFSSATQVFEPEIGIPVNGDNTATATFGLAFFTDGGLVYAVDGAGIRIVTADNTLSNIWSDDDNTFIGATSESDGEGNTLLIQAASTDGAAEYCYTVIAPATEWYLPAIEELEAIYTNLHLLGFGNFSGSNYWSSTETSITDAASLSFANGSRNPFLGKDTPLSFRCARLVGTS